MTLYYSATTGGFYDNEVHTTISDDALKIAPQSHQNLLMVNAQGASKNLV